MVQPLKKGVQLAPSVRTKFIIPYRKNTSQGVIAVENFGRAPLTVTLECLGQRQTKRIPSGKHTFTVDLTHSTDEDGAVCMLLSEAFCPAQQGINDDFRQLGVHVNSFEFV